MKYVRMYLCMYLFKGANELCCVGGHVEDGTHHAGGGGEQEQTGELTTLQRRNKPYLQRRGNLKDKSQ